MKLHCTSSLSPVQEKFLVTRRELSESLIERDEEIDLLLTALICKEHALLVGPPGTAKSLLLDSLLSWMQGLRFTALLTRFTSPEELFGPISLQALKEDRYHRITTGKLPQAHLVYLDEIFKASTAILNTLLRILNERLFDHGDGKLSKVPLLLCVASSNEYPSAQDGGKELGAAFDRFLFRKTVRPILSQAGRQRLLWQKDHTPKLSTQITPLEIHQAGEEARVLPWTESAKAALETILRELSREGIQPGDRRQHKCVAACGAFAYLQGAEQVDPEHLDILTSILWEDPAEQPGKCAQVIARIANPTGMRVNQLLLECEQILGNTDVTNLAQAATATAKLGEIDKRLASLKGNGRIERARTYLREQIRQLKIASIEAI